MGLHRQAEIVKLQKLKKGVSTKSHLSRSAGHGDFAPLLDVIIFRIHNELRRSDVHIKINSGYERLLKERVF